MVKKTHTQGGVLSALLTGPVVMSWTMLHPKGVLTQFICLASYICGSYIGSLLPDIDMKSSYISKKCRLLYMLLGSKFKHRGFTHSLMFLFIIWLGFEFINIFINPGIIISFLMAGTVTGCMSHIILDLFTKEGVTLLYPIDRTISLCKIKTNSKKEKNLSKAIEFVMFVALGYNLYILFQRII